MREYLPRQLEAQGFAEEARALRGMGVFVDLDKAIEALGAVSHVEWEWPEGERHVTAKEWKPFRVAIMENDEYAAAVAAVIDKAWEPWRIARGGADRKAVAECAKAGGRSNMFVYNIGGVLSELSLCAAYRHRKLGIAA